MTYISSNIVRKTLFKKNSFCEVLKANIKSWSIVFFGSDYYSLFCLKALHNEMKRKTIGRMEVVVVNKQNAVYEYTVSNDIKTHFWPPNLNGSYDFGVIVSFGKFIPKSIIDLFPLGIINVHASLLPKYRGGMPIVHAIKNGDTSTGVTVTRINAYKFDVGEIILQKSCAIDKNELMPSLYKRLTHLGCECLLQVINDMPKCLYNCFPQGDKDVSYAPKLKKEDAIVRWSDITALELFNLHRALFGTFELTSTWKEKNVKFVCLFLGDSNSDSLRDEECTKLEPGSFTYNKNTQFFYVQCKDKPIVVCTLKYNSKMYRAVDFANGYLKDIEKSFWKFKS